MDGRVDELAVAEAKPNRAPGTRYGAWFIDSMPPATTSSASPGADLRGREHDRLEPGAADAVDRRGRGAVRQTGHQRRLAGRRLTDAGLEDLAHQDFVDGGRRGLETGPLDRRANGDAAQVRCGNRAQRSAELADRRARGGDEIDVAVGAGIVLDHGPNLHLDPVRLPRQPSPGERLPVIAGGGGPGLPVHRGGRRPREPISSSVGPDRRRQLCRLASTWCALGPSLLRFHSSTIGFRCSDGTLCVDETTDGRRWCFNRAQARSKACHVDG